MEYKKTEITGQSMKIIAYINLSFILISNLYTCIVTGKRLKHINISNHTLDKSDSRAGHLCTTFSKLIYVCSSQRVSPSEINILTSNHHVQHSNCFLRYTIYKPIRSLTALSHSLQDLQLCKQVPTYKLDNVH